MQVHTFTAETAAQAVEQIRRELGPEALVVNVRQLPAAGLACLWQKPRIEVRACLPEPTPPPSATDLLAELRQELAEIKQQIAVREPGAAAPVAAGLISSEASSGLPPAPEASGATDPSAPSTHSGFGSQGFSSPLGRWLERSGLLAPHIQRVLDEARAKGGALEERAPAEQLAAARAALLSLWRPAAGPAADAHVFIGPAGAGKTTVLSKWLAQTVLVEGRRARVWRLDGRAANTAESLSVLAEILGVPLERFGTDAAGVPGSEALFIDLPGVNWREPAELEELGRRVAELRGVRVHLVLNAAYESDLLLAQARAFSRLPVGDVILTHVDEERRWGKLWNLVLGTNFTVSFLSEGQNIPGGLMAAEPERLLAALLPVK